ncbi:competence protein ComK [Aquibacillus rhizosphaerae]|uniref:Competence protein ComK n=1 Tax=Aquibacillus rhizosphaerae TaxID=3051431 RepID=A0ABT7L787_9BACI|nr:competence protein ComK [Aquibacillus sp. LR5S19]MDL4841733.1 competence protein ComK [Aquibacillus sp. LR5S19]
MSEIVSNYHVNEHTMALLPATNFEYDTKVLESNRQLFVKKTPIHLIKSACLNGCSTYDGRRSAVTYQTGAQRKVPIPISPSKNLFTFPTCSPNEFNCHWIFYNHVHSIIPYHASHKSVVKSMIIFKNGQKLAMTESYYLLEKQMQRTAVCILQYASFQHQRFMI